MIDPQVVQRIVDTIQARRDSLHPWFHQMERVASVVDADTVVIPLPDVQGESGLPKSTPLLIANAVDDLGMRAASVMPNIVVPSLTKGRQHGARSREYARLRAKALAADWNDNGMSLMLARSFRQLVGYSTCDWIVRVGANGRPEIRTVDPLTCFPDWRHPDDPSNPEDCAFVWSMSSSRLRALYPQVRAENGGPIGPESMGDEEIWSLFEWVDAERWVFGLLGPDDVQRSRFGSRAYYQAYGSWWMVLAESPNTLGRCPVVTGRRPSLSRVGSTVARLLDHANLLDRFMTLWTAATEKAIFPDMYALSRPGATVRVLTDDGTWKDGRTGQVNVLDGAESVGVLRPTPDPNTMIAMDRIEGAINTSLKSLPQFRGETYGALRTGRGIDTLSSIALDPMLKELQEVQAKALTSVNDLALEVYRRQGRTHLLWTGWPGDDELFEFGPKHVESTKNTVMYPVPGADLQQTTVVLGQLKGMESISQRTLMELHPLVKDPPGEQSRIDEEVVERIAREAFAQQMLQGMIPLEVGAMVERFVRQGFDFHEAVLKAADEARRRQAEEAQVVDQQPGLTAPPVPMAEAPQPQPPPRTPDQMRQMLAALQESV